MRTLPSATATAPSITQDQRPAHSTPALITLIVDMLKASGATAETIAAAELLLQRGQTFEVTLEASKKLGLGDFHNILVSFDLVARRVASHKPLRPWIKAVEQVRQEIRPTAVFIVSCGDHRPGHHDATDALDTLPCTRDAYHDGDHGDQLGKTWARTNTAAGVDAL